MQNERNLRIVLAVSLIILAVLAGFALLRPLVKTQQYSALARESVVKADDQWIIQFDIINMEETNTSYKLVWTNGGDVSTENINVPKGKIYTNIRHVYPGTLQGDTITLTICKGDDTLPFENTTYHLK